MYTWTNHPFSNDQPVANGVFVECRTVDGFIFCALSQDINWEKTGSVDDVVAYRVVGYDDRDW